MEIEQNLVDENQVIDDPETEPSENIEDVAETHEQTEQEKLNSAFAEQRRAREEAEVKAAQLEAQIATMENEKQARSSAFQRLGGTEEADIAALAETIGITQEEVLATINEEQALANEKRENEKLRSELEEVKAEKFVNEALEEVKRLDPNITKLEELGDKFIDLIADNGLSVEDAYYAIKAREIATKANPAPQIGKVNNEPIEKDFYTQAEVANMSSEEKTKNADKIMASFKKWK